jgi:N-acetylglucosaminyl-diphospho-decaprenol L-rhamnosyltransferase
MISVLTVNHRSSADVAGLAASLDEHRGGESIELIVVNHSSRERIKLPAGTRAWSRVIEQPNRGFAAGINAAFAASRGELLLVANPDVRLTSGALTCGREYLETHPDVGVLLPRLRYPDGRVQPSVRRFYTWLSAWYARTPFRAIGFRPQFWREYLYEDLDASGPVDVDWGLGAAMFLRRGDFTNDEVFDPRYFLYFEDVDLCFRTWQRGRRVVYHPGIECVHALRRRSGVPLGRHGWHHFCSFWRFVAKHGGLPGRRGGR